MAHFRGSPSVNKLMGDNLALEHVTRLGSMVMKMCQIPGYPGYPASVAFHKYIFSNIEHGHIGALYDRGFRLWL